MAKQAFPDVPRIENTQAPSRSSHSCSRLRGDLAEKIDGKSMRDHLRFAVCYWHTFRNQLSDPFGVGTAIRPWDDGSNSIANAERRVRVAFEFIEKLGAPFYCFHDRDVAPKAKTCARRTRTSTPS